MGNLRNTTYVDLVPFLPLNKGQQLPTTDTTFRLVNLGYREKQTISHLKLEGWHLSVFKLPKPNWSGKTKLA